MITSSKSHVSSVTIQVIFERSYVHAKFHSQGLAGAGFMMGKRSFLLGYLISEKPRLVSVKQVF